MAGHEAWMHGRTVLVTGAGSGIGRATATALGRAGALVLAHARDRRRAAALAEQLANDGGRYLPVHGDLAALAGVRGLADQVRQAAPDGLHVLVNNAGAAFTQRSLSADGVELTMAVNHLAVAGLTAALLGPLRRAATTSGRPARVVNVSSTMEKRGNPSADWTYPGRFSQLQAYADSKLVNLAYTYALARDLAGGDITVNAANPGGVATRFGHNAGGLLKVVQVVGRLWLASPEQGARTSIRLASDPALDGSTGGYYTAGEPDESSAVSRDPEFGARVQARTAELLAR